MCGICGIWSRSGVSESSLRAMAEVIQHRGPDDEGFYFGPNIGLANRRLSIIDLDHGRQPISNETGSVHLVFNGEIYNYRELRKELIQQGHQFATETDTEVIVHCYEQYGMDSLKKLRGMFAFALWDTAKERLLLARDPLGQKPLYYSLVNDQLVFGFGNQVDFG